jgi:hypothetical protein
MNDAGHPCLTLMWNPLPVSSHAIISDDRQVYVTSMCP